jgi:hypothetical protein
MYKQSVDGQMRSQVDSGKEIMKLLDGNDNQERTINNGISLGRKD